MNQNKKELDYSVTQYYVARSTQVDFEVEDTFWVPKAAINLMRQVLGQHFSDLPTQPFLHLLTQLNRIWKQREAERLNEQQRQHERDMEVAMRLQKHATPYQQKVMSQRMAFLRKELRLTRVLPLPYIYTCI
jgi:hypothetical protein